MNFSFIATALYLAIKGTFVIAQHGLTEDTPLKNSGQPCSIEEWDLIGNTILDSLQDRRQLRAESGPPPKVTATRSCRKACKPGKLCVAAGDGCDETTDRRQLQGASVEAAKCSDQVARVNAAMDALAPSLSPTCQVELQNEPDFTCYEAANEDAVPTTVTPCHMKGFALWNAAAGTVAVPDFTNGSAVCKKAFPFSIQAVTDSCVKKVQLDLIGANGFIRDHSDSSAPFFLSGHEGASIIETNLEPGQYYLTAFPDEDVTLAKTITFHVNDC